jgi:hypothetical protein
VANVQEISAGPRPLRPRSSVRRVPGVWATIWATGPRPERPLASRSRQFYAEPLDRQEAGKRSRRPRVRPRRHAFRQGSEPPRCLARLRLSPPSPTVVHSGPHQEVEILPRTGAWHSVSADVHHNNTNCNAGKNIEHENFRQGTGGKALCAECARLNIQGQ